MFSLNIQDYDKDDILELLDIHTRKYDLDIIYNRTQELLNDILRDNSNTKKEKHDISDFIFKCFKKICSIQELVIPSYMLQDLKTHIYRNTSFVEGSTPSIQLTPNENTTVNSIQQETTIFSQNDNQIIEHPNTISTNSFPLRYKSGVVNPFKKQTYNYNLNINSRFRNNYYTVPSTDFMMNLPNPIKNVVSMRLVSNEIPYSFYIYSSITGTNEFTVEILDISGMGTNDEDISKNIQTIRIPNGNYTAQQLETFLNTVIFTQSPLDRIKVQYIDIANKFIFYRDYDTVPDPNPATAITYGFNLDFRLVNDSDRNIQYNMGWLLGYRRAFYSWSEDYVDASNASFDLYEGMNPESTFNCSSTKYLLLHVNDFNKNHTKVFETPIQEGLIRSNDVLAKIPVFNISYVANVEVLNPIKNNRREYFGPVNIEKLEVRLLDEFGRIVDLNNCDYSFSLEIECLYDL
jgi:hypothetical protein